MNNRLRQQRSDSVTYIGDAVYVEIDQLRDMIKLFVSYGRGEVETIYLEREVWNNLIDLLKRKGWVK